MENSYKFRMPERRARVDGFTKWYQCRTHRFQHICIPTLHHFLVLKMKNRNTEEKISVFPFFVFFANWKCNGLLDSFIIQNPPPKKLYQQQFFIPVAMMIEWRRQHNIFALSNVLRCASLNLRFLVFFSHFYYFTVPSQLRKAFFGIFLSFW